jgi:hypothetical protein
MEKLAILGSNTPVRRSSFKLPDVRHNLHNRGLSRLHTLCTNIFGFNGTSEGHNAV